MFKTFSFYGDIFFRVFIGHRESKLKILSKTYKNINPFGILIPMGIMLLAIPF